MVGIFTDDEDYKEVQDNGIILEFEHLGNLDIQIPSKKLNIQLKEEVVLKMKEVDNGKRKRTRSSRW